MNSIVVYLLISIGYYSHQTTVAQFAGKDECEATRSLMSLSSKGATYCVPAKVLDTRVPVVINENPKKKGK